MEWLGETTLRLYRGARAYALERGIILADTKFEFGRLPGQDTPILIDEIFTPDSSRFWPADQWVPGQEQQSFDKADRAQLLGNRGCRGANGTRRRPAQPCRMKWWPRSAARYEEAYRLLTGASI